MFLFRFWTKPCESGSCGGWMWTCFSFGSGSETQRSRYDHSYNRFEQCDGRSYGVLRQICQQELGFLLLLRSASVLWFSTCNAADKLFFLSALWQIRPGGVSFSATHITRWMHTDSMLGERMRSHLMNSDHPFQCFPIWSSVTVNIEWPQIQLEYN